MLLRNARVSDLPELVDVQQAGSRAALAHIFPQDVHPFPRAAILQRWVSEVECPDVEVYVATRAGGRIDGFAAVRGSELLHFGTAVGTWGTGFAADVHREVIGRMAAAGNRAARLQVFGQNHRARRFYEKMGWSATRRLSRSAFAPYPVLVTYEIVLWPAGPDSSSGAGRRTRPGAGGSVGWQRD